MSLLDVIQDKQIVLDTKVSRTTEVTAEERVGESWRYMSEPQLKEDYLNRYRTVEWVYACIDAIASSLAGTPIRIFKITKQNDDTTRQTMLRLIQKHKSIVNIEKLLIKGGTKAKEIHTKIADVEEITDGSLVDILDQVNPYTIASHFNYGTVAHLELKGNSFWEMVGEKDADISTSNPPVEMYLLNPNNVAIIPDKKTYIKMFIYVVNGKQIRFEPSDIIHLKYFDPTREHYGIGSVEPLLNTLVMDNNAVDYNKRFFKNSARVDGVLQTKNRLADPVFERVKKTWEDRYGGIKNSHKIAILEQGLEYKQIGLSQKDADFIQARNMNRDVIFSVFGLFPSILGLKVANFATAQVEERLFWSRTIRPKARIIDQSMNSYFVPYWGDDMFIERDFSEVEALKVDNSEEHVRLFSIGAISQNEIREESNRPGVEGGDVLYINPQMIPVATTTGEELPDFGEDENDTEDDDDIIDVGDEDDE